jgi:predicted  nucleic acid-binding Zn-ribbon protein
MSLRLRHLEIRIRTLRGFFGIRLPLQAKGLVVVRANNTSGKSTCVQSLIYALGLEAMLTVSQQAPPLQYAVLERFQYGDEEVRVDESEVLLEMENGAGEIITIQRAIVSKMRKTNLVTVWRGPHLSQPSAEYSKADYFVRIEGAAQRPLGFHTFLASYLGWALPTVTRFDGSEVPLYVECIFPLFVIEQKHGWSGIQSRMPTHFRIREMGKRAIEFVLKLDSYEIAERRQRLRDQIAAIEQRWEHIVGELDAKVGALGAVVRNLPKVPVSEWPIVPAPECLVFDGKEWDRLQSATLHANARLLELQKTEVPMVSSASARVAGDLRNAQKQLAALEVLAARALRDNEVEEAQNASIRERISALEADLQNYQDLKRLRDIGSDLKLSVATGRCPTCEQEINDVLLPQAAAAPPMSYDDNIKFISGQIVAFKTMLNDSERVLEARRRAVNGSRLKVEELRANIRAYKQTLTSPNSSASAADVRERMAVENALRIFETLTEQLDTALEQLEMLSREFAEYTAALEKLRSDASEQDEGKLQSLQTSFVSQLDQYGFSSIKPAGLLHISRETYRPTYEGFDLGFNLSASDMIRTIWAYLYGLMEVARTWPTNHLGLLVLDEPRQQQADKVSFAEFARRAAAAGGAGQQVLFMTSEDPETLASMLSGVEHQYINFEGKMIQPMAVGPTPLE